MRQRDAERRARRFVDDHYGAYAHWNFDLCEEKLGRTSRGGKTWSFGLEPDEEDADYESGCRFVGYVHFDGAVGRMY